MDASLAAHNIHLKRFSAIPLADLEMVMPEKKVFVPPSVLLQLAAAVVVAVAGLVATLFSRGQGWAVWGPALLLLASRASAVYAAAASERNEIEREMNKLVRCAVHAALPWRLLASCNLTSLPRSLPPHCSCLSAPRRRRRRCCTP